MVVGGGGALCKKIVLIRARALRRRIRVNPKANAKLFDTTAIMLSRWSVINKIYMTAQSNLTILMGVCGQKQKNPVDKS